MKNKSFSHVLANNVALFCVFGLSFLLPAYVWFPPLQKMALVPQLWLSALFCGLFYFFMRLAVYVFKHIETEESQKRGKTLTRLYMIAGAVNFVLYLAYFSDGPFVKQNILQIITLGVMGRIAYRVLKKHSPYSGETVSTPAPNTAA